MVSITNNTLSTTYTFEIISNASYSIEVFITPMPIPTFQTPLLMNFGGTSITITFNYTTTVESDVNTLISDYASANPNTSFTLDMTSEWGSGATWNGVVQRLDIQEDSGNIKWDGTLSFAVGELVS